MNWAKAVLLFLSCLLGFHSQACVSTSELQLANPNVELQTLFYITSRKASIRMAITQSPVDNRPIFTLMKCEEPKPFTIEGADEWAPFSCTPISPLWLPLHDTSEESNEMVLLLTAQIRQVLSTYRTTHELDQPTEIVFDSINTAFNAVIGGSLEFYAKKYTPLTWLGRRARFFARSTGYVFLGSVLVGGVLDVTSSFRDKSHLNKVEEFSSLIEGLDNEAFFKFDGNESSTQVYTVLSVIETAIRDSSTAIYNQYCQQTIGTKIVE